MEIRRVRRSQAVPRGVTRDGFTLIELLVVVAIIALLISILLPSLSKARGRTKDIKCRTQLRALGLAFNMYTIDTNGWIPLNQWRGYAASPYGGMRAADYPWPVLLHPYQGPDHNIHLCPKMPRKIYPTQQKYGDDEVWQYFEEFMEDGRPVYATSYQMKPDLGSADQRFVPPMGSVGGVRFERFFKYDEDGEIPLHIDIANELGDNNIYKVVTRTTFIKAPGRVMLFGDRYTWHERRDGEVRQLVYTDGHCEQLRYKLGELSSEYELRGRLYHTYENYEIVPQPPDGMP